jgi:hypothetical protein
MALLADNIIQEVIPATKIPGLTPFKDQRGLIHIGDHTPGW